MSTSVRDNSYGTLSNAERGQQSDNDESTALLTSRKSQQHPWTTKIQEHLTENVDRHWGDVPLLLGYFVTGLLDTSSIMTWGTFVSMQTGNTVYLGLGLVAPSEGNRWIKALLALSSFWFGSFVFARYHRFFSPRKRWVILASYILQFALISGAAAIITWGPETVKEGPLKVEVVVPIIMLAVQAAGQAVISRVLKIPSLNTVVLTSIYCDLWSDEHLFAGLHANTERNRRAAAPILLLGGAMVAAVCDRSVVGFAGALWTAAAVKALIIIAWWAWKPVKQSIDALQ